MIRIDEIRALHHDLHMRPFEADRRVYLILDAHRLNDDAAAALLKDLEEPPSYATLVLVADELGPLPETIRSRCQLVPFRRLSRARGRSWIASPRDRARGGGGGVLARVSGGRLDRAARLLDPDARARRAALLDAARAAYRDETFDPAAAAGVVLDVRPCARRGRPRARAGARRRARPAGARGRPARPARRVRCGARGAARLARRPRRVVPRPRRRRRGRGGRGRPRRPARRAARRRRGRGGGGRRAGGRGRPPSVARDRGVQPQRLAPARGAVRPPAAVVQPRSASRTVKRNRPALRARVLDRGLALARAHARQLERRSSARSGQRAAAACRAADDLDATARRACLEDALPSRTLRFGPSRPKSTVTRSSDASVPSRTITTGLSAGRVSVIPAGRPGRGRRGSPAGRPASAARASRSCSRGGGSYRRSPRRTPR